jgi:hypothetical protein
MPGRRVVGKMDMRPTCNQAFSQAWAVCSPFPGILSAIAIFRQLLLLAVRNAFQA